MSGATRAILPAECAALLREAASLRALSLVFERPTSAVLEERDRLHSELTDEAARAAVAAASFVDEGSHLSLFGPAGVISLREVGWRGRVDPGELLADLAAFYKAFAYTPRREEPEDHLAVQVGFIAYLNLKQAYARANHDDGADEVVAAARTRFLDEHPRRWIGRLAVRLEAMAIDELVPAASLLAERLGPCATEDVAGRAGLDDPAFPSCDGFDPGMNDQAPWGCEQSCGDSTEQGGPDAFLV